MLASDKVGFLSLTQVGSDSCELSEEAYCLPSAVVTG